MEQAGLRQLPEPVRLDKGGTHMRLFNMEFYKIVSRPVMNLGFLVMAGMSILILCQEAAGTRTEIDGNVYYGLEAVAKERSLVREYEGIFTMEKAEDIVERFGFSGYVGGENGEFVRVREGNFCSQFVTDKMTDFLQTEKRPNQFSGGDVWENYGKQYLEGDFRFGYTKGWEKLQEVCHLAAAVLNVWLLFMVAPVFSEEYSRNTTEILLTTKQGKSGDVRRKIEAAMALGILSYLLLLVLMFALTAGIYGMEGLYAGVSGTYTMYGEHGIGSMGFFLFLQVLTGLASVLLQISITLYLSSKCRRPVTSVMAGLFLYLLPFGMNEVMFQLLAALGTAEYFWGWILMDVIRICCFSMPVYLPNPGILFIPSNWLRYIPVIAAAVLILCIWRGYQNYRNYEKNR